MIVALVIFLVMYALMLTFQKYRPWIALSTAAIFIILGIIGVYDMSIIAALKAVITDNPDELSNELIEKLHHGVSEIKVMGMYSHTEKYMVVCIIRKRQIGEMMKIIKKYPGSFANYSKVNEVFGRFRK